MKKNLPRRDFIMKASAACMGGCILLSTKGALAAMLQDDQIIKPEELCYCGYKCPDDCQFLVASQKNDPGLKKAAYDEWGLEKRFGLEFDADKVFCFSCKPVDRPEGPVLKCCTVRSCAKEKGYQACIQCNMLNNCDRELWTRFPQFHHAVIKMQLKYLEQA
jgi:hypothetical protein